MTDNERTQIEAALTSQISSLRQERDNAATHIASLTAKLRQAELVVGARAIDVGRARAELIAMRERSQALAEALDAAAMSKLRAERDAQWLMTSKSHSEAEAVRALRTLQDVYASTSWRVTRPLRALARPRRTIEFVLRRLRLS